jgi:thiamine biosynthesis protein ThiS
MKLIVNGQLREFETAPTGSELLATLGVPASLAVAEVNGHIVPRAAFIELVLSDGDVIELVTLVGGGL